MTTKSQESSCLCFPNHYKSLIPYITRFMLYVHAEKSELRSLPIEPSLVPLQVLNLEFLFINFFIYDLCIFFYYLPQGLQGVLFSFVVLFISFKPKNLPKANVCAWCKARVQGNFYQMQASVSTSIGFDCQLSWPLSEISY